MDPAAHTPSAELRASLIYMVEFFCQEWVVLPLKEYQEELSLQLQRMISRLPWLFGSLHPLIQEFLISTVHVDQSSSSSWPVKGLSARPTVGFMEWIAFPFFPKKRVFTPPSLYAC